MTEFPETPARRPARRPGTTAVRAVRPRAWPAILAFAVVYLAAMLLVAAPGVVTLFGP